MYCILYNVYVIVMRIESVGWEWRRIHAWKKAICFVYITCTMVLYKAPFKIESTKKTCPVRLSILFGFTVITSLDWCRVVWLRWVWAKAVRRHMHAPESQLHIIK
jgi:hypothetical protein